MDPIRVSATLLLDSGALEARSVRSSGPGGQNVNKTASKVVLLFDFENAPALPPHAKQALRTRHARFLDAAGRLVVRSQATRDRVRNLELARAQLAELVREALRVRKRRRPTRPSQGSVARRLDDKRRNSQQKSLRRSSGDA